jgi:hypothetical protein
MIRYKWGDSQGCKVIFSSSNCIRYSQVIVKFIKMYLNKKNIYYLFDIFPIHRIYKGRNPFRG